jgi:hypothetical protein
MQLRLLLISLLFLAVAPGSWAVDVATEREIELIDGGRVVLRVDGTTDHHDAAGRPVAMTDGVVMTARDGTRILMKAASLWREIVEQATVNFALASALPLRRDPATPRVVELGDGGRITLRADGSMIHTDGAGNQVRMAEGDVMVATDGTKIMMSNGTLWSSALNHDKSLAGR